MEALTMGKLNCIVFGKRLADLRQKLDITQSDLSKQLNIQRVSIAKYETGQRAPALEHLLVLADFFGVPTDYLLGLSDVSSYNTDLQSVCKYTGLSENAIKNIKAITCEQDYSNGNDITSYDEITHEYNLELFEYLLDNDIMRKLLHSSFIYALDRIKYEIEENEHPNPLVEREKDFNEFCFMKEIKQFIGDNVVSYCKKNDIYQKYCEEQHTAMCEITDYLNSVGEREVPDNGQHNPSKE